MSPFVVPLLVLCLVAVVGVSIWAQRSFLREVRGLHERVAELEVRACHADEDRGRLQERVRDAERLLMMEREHFHRMLVNGFSDAVRELEQPPSVNADTPPEKPPPSLYERIGKDEDDP